MCLIFKSPQLLQIIKPSCNTFLLITEYIYFEGESNQDIPTANIVFEI